MLITNMGWDLQLTNRDSDLFQLLSREIEQNVVTIFQPGPALAVKVIQFSSQEDGVEAKVVIREVTKAASKVMDRAKAVEALATTGVAMVEEAAAIAVAVAISITTIVATMAEVVTAVAKIMDLVAILTLSRVAGQATIRWEEEEVVVV